MSIHGKDLFGGPIRTAKSGKLAEAFLVPPFSVMNACEGWWQDRKRAWIALGIRSELGRDDSCMAQGKSSAYTGASGWAGARGGQRVGRDRLTPGESGANSVRGLPMGAAFSGGLPVSRGDPNKYHRKGDPEGAAPPQDGGLLGFADGPAVEAPQPTPQEPEPEDEAPDGETPRPKKHAANTRGLTYGISANAYAKPKDADGAHPNDVPTQSGTSIFDPVLTECLVRWFSPEGGTVIDPFAGGSVRGIVSAYLGRPYWGCDLSARQIEANRGQLAGLPKLPAAVVWEAGDSREKVPAAPAGDMVLSCPPYADLEVYSDDPRDLSNMEYGDFIQAYSDVIFKIVDRLKQDRFIAWVVGEVRDPATGNCRGFVKDTIDCFTMAGARYYNEIVLVTARGSLPVRVERQFRASRKIGRTHQTALIFVKGDGKKAAAACGALAAASF